MIVFGVVGGVFEEFSVECFSVGNQGFVKKKGRLVWCKCKLFVWFRVLVSRV